jgi:hypothetical protein
MITRKQIRNGETTLISLSWYEVKEKRNQELKNSDWRFMSDQTPSQEWIDYRQFLRDLPQEHTEANDAADAWNEYIIPE